MKEDTLMLPQLTLLALCARVYVCVLLSEWPMMPTWPTLFHPALPPQTLTKSSLKVTVTWTGLACVCVCVCECESVCV